MISAFKQILLQISRLPARDQRWIVKQLSPAAQSRFSQKNGPALLKEAARFSAVAPQDSALPDEPCIALPAYANALAIRAPLYVAIVMEQGRYPWAGVFFNAFDTSGAIRSLMDNQVLDIKPQVKQAVLNAWEASLSFEQHLETSHA